MAEWTSEVSKKEGFYWFYGATYKKPVKLETMRITKIQSSFL